MTIEATRARDAGSGAINAAPERKIVGVRARCSTDPDGDRLAAVSARPAAP